MLSVNSRVLTSHRQFDTDSRDEIRHVLTSRYGARSFDVTNGGQTRGVGSLLRLKDVDLGYLHFSQQVRASFPAVGYYRQQFSIAGRSTTRFGGHVLDVDLETTGVVPADSDADCEYGKNQHQLVFRVTEGALQRKFAALVGANIPRRFEFAFSDKFENPRQRRLRRLIHAFVHEIEEGELSEFATAEFSQLLIVKFLTANQHNWSHLLGGTALTVAPHNVQTVEEYIAANWDKPLTIENLIEHCGVGVRNLFVTFKKKRGYSPMAFHRMIRLQHGREMLLFPTEDTSVLAVSIRCGFHNAGHFAKYYKQAFGELPSMTLAVGRSRR